MLWEFSLPAAQPTILSTESPLAAARELTSRPLFTGPGSSATAAVPASHTLHLVAVLHSDQTGSARAIVRQDGASQPLVLGVGDEVADGMTIQRIEQQQITLAANGQELVLALPQPSNPATGPAQK